MLRSTLSDNIFDLKAPAPATDILFVDNITCKKSKEHMQWDWPLIS